MKEFSRQGSRFSVRVILLRARTYAAFTNPIERRIGLLLGLLLAAAVRGLEEVPVKGQ